MSRPLVLSAFLAAWLATGILAGAVMARRRRDRFPWWLLGGAFGALIVPLAFVAEHGEQPTCRASSTLMSPDQPAPVVVAVNHSPEAVAVLAAGLDGRGRKAG
jgi:hypothetical protein